MWISAFRAIAHGRENDKIPGTSRSVKNEKNLERGRRTRHFMLSWHATVFNVHVLGKGGLIAPLNNGYQLAEW